MDRSLPASQATAAYRAIDLGSNKEAPEGCSAYLAGDGLLTQELANDVMWSWWQRFVYLSNSVGRHGVGSRKDCWKR